MNVNDLPKHTVEDEHAIMFRELCKSGDDILLAMSPSKMHLLHMASKLCSEAGELMDAVGKWCFYNKPLDVANVVEELGDIEFYLRGIREGVLVHRATVLQANVEKLRKRYGNKYSDTAAHVRADKQ